MKRKELEKHLRACGCRLDHSGGNHDVWTNTKTLAQSTVPRHTEVNTFTAKGICKQLGIPAPKGR